MLHVFLEQDSFLKSYMHSLKNIKDGQSPTRADFRGWFPMRPSGVGEPSSAKDSSVKGQCCVIQGHGSLMVQLKAKVDFTVSEGKWFSFRQ